MINLIQLLIWRQRKIAYRRLQEISNGLKNDLMNLRNKSVKLFIAASCYFISRRRITWTLGFTEIAYKIAELTSRADNAGMFLESSSHMSSLITSESISPGEIACKLNYLNSYPWEMELEILTVIFTGSSM